MHRVSIDRVPEPSTRAVITGEEAYHAVVVKRLEPGERLELIDGRGGVARAVIEALTRSKKAPELTVLVEDLTTQSRADPLIHVWSAVPKGDRAGQMIDQLAQCGADSWAPLATTRGVAEPTGNKLDRLERVAVESSKQCGRAWHLTIDGRERSVADAVAWARSPGRVLVVADVTGGRPTPPPSGEVVVLIGPEGGWTPDELRRLTEGGAVPATFGPYVMRLETAAVAAVCQLRVARGPLSSPPDARR